MMQLPKAQTDSTDSSYGEAVASHGRLTSHQDAAAEGDSAYRDEQNEVAKDTGEGLAKISIQGTAYREEGQGTSVADRQEADREPGFWGIRALFPSGETRTRQQLTWN